MMITSAGVANRWLMNSCSLCTYGRWRLSSFIATGNVTASANVEPKPTTAAVTWIQMEIESAEIEASMGPQFNAIVNSSSTGGVCSASRQPLTPKQRMRTSVWVASIRRKDLNIGGSFQSNASDTKRWKPRPAGSGWMALPAHRARRESVVSAPGGVGLRGIVAAGEVGRLVGGG